MAVAGDCFCRAAAPRARALWRRGDPAGRVRLALCRRIGIADAGHAWAPAHARLPLSESRRPRGRARTAARVLLVRGSRRLVLPDQSAQFPQEQHRLKAPWRLLLAGRCGTEAGVRLGRRRLLSGKAWQAGASREVNVPVEEKVPLVVLLVRVAPLSSWITGLRQRPAARGAAASFPGLPPPYRDGETAAIGARGF